MIKQANLAQLTSLLVPIQTQVVPAALHHRLPILKWMKRKNKDFVINCLTRIQAQAIVIHPRPPRLMNLALIERKVESTQVMMTLFKT